jgi:hypothetical protein
MLPLRADFDDPKILFFLRSDAAVAAGLRDGGNEAEVDASLRWPTEEYSKGGRGERKAAKPFRLLAGTLSDWRNRA